MAQMCYSYAISSIARTDYGSGGLEPVHVSRFSVCEDTQETFHDQDQLVNYM